MTESQKAGSRIIAKGLELAINQALRWSSNADELLASLSNKHCIIYVQELEQALLFSFQSSTRHSAKAQNAYLQNDEVSWQDKAKHVEVCVDQEGIYHEIPEELDDDTCWLSVSLFALDALKQNNQLTKLIKSGQLDFAGNLGILQGLSRLFEKLDIDVEEVLSAYVGDVPAYQLNKSFKQFKAHAQSQFAQLTQTFSDAALDEKPIGVRRIMLINFVDEVSELRTDVDRLEARLSILEDNKQQTKGRKPE